VDMLSIVIDGLGRTPAPTKAKQKMEAQKQAK
jgi:hypothetical protein